MNHVSRLGALTMVLLVAVASPVLAGSSTGKARTAAKAVTSAPAPGASVPPVPAPTLVGPLASSPTQLESSWTPSESFWTPLPSRFDDWSWSAMRVEWDAEAGTWGMASAPDPAAAGVFGARLPSDRPIQITRPDGTVMLLIGPEGMEYLTVQRGSDGRFHLNCTHDPAPIAAPAVRWPEK